jgi:hypothetical protein
MVPVAAQKVFLQEGVVRVARGLSQSIYRSYVRPFLLVSDIIKYGDLDGPYDRRWGCDVPQILGRPFA